jgi:hypothetical protein
MFGEWDEARTSNNQKKNLNRREVVYIKNEFCLGEEGVQEAGEDNTSCHPLKGVARGKSKFHSQINSSQDKIFFYYKFCN